MAIVFDPKEDAANLAKHGVSLTRDAVMDMDDALYFTRPVGDETRTVYVGPIDDVLHVAVMTWRGRDERVISLRPASRRERREYAKAKGL